MSVNSQDAIETLTLEEPSYDELTVLYDALRIGTDHSAVENVSQRALANLIRDMLDYLDFVQAELQKSVGITRSAERERILQTLQPPTETEPVQCVNELISQWESIERYGLDDLETIKMSEPAR